MPNTALKLPEHNSITPADADIARPEQPTAEHNRRVQDQLRLTEAHGLLMEQSRIQHDELIEARDIRLLTTAGLRIGTREYPPGQHSTAQPLHPDGITCGIHAENASLPAADQPQPRSP